MSDLVKKLLFWAGIALALTTTIAVLLSFTGCVSAPDKKDYVGRPDACFDAALCMYYNNKNPDKTICSDQYKECRAYERFLFCKDTKNLPPDVNFQSCMDKINSK
jgi:hypothetical protein